MWLALGGVRNGKAKIDWKHLAFVRVLAGPFTSHSDGASGRYARIWKRSKRRRVRRRSRETFVGTFDLRPIAPRSVSIVFLGHPFFFSSRGGISGFTRRAVQAEAELSKNRPPSNRPCHAGEGLDTRVEGTHPLIFFRCKSATWHGEVGRAVACIRYGTKGPRARVVAWTAG